jgi:hypothetical protein
VSVRTVVRLSCIFGIATRGPGRDRAPSAFPVQFSRRRLWIFRWAPLARAVPVAVGREPSMTTAHRYDGRISVTAAPGGKPTLLDGGLKGPKAADTPSHAASASG